MLLNLLFLCIGLVILIYGANFLVDGGSALAHRLKVSNMLIGLTVVAFGTSMPELVVNVMSATQGSSALALGNVLGSNIFNILAILGATALIIPLNVQRTTTWIEVPLTLLAAAIVFVMIGLTSCNVMTRVEGGILLFCFVGFLSYTLMLAKKGGAGNDEEVEIKLYSTTKSVVFILLGLGGLIGGGHLLVNGAVGIAQTFGISERIIGLTIVSIGTSLPELATSIIAARKNNADIAIGNVVGSNIFNIFLILGITTTITPLEAPAGIHMDLLVNLIASTLLFLFIFTGKGRKINRIEGLLFITLYLAYLVMLIRGENLV